MTASVEDKERREDMQLGGGIKEECGRLVRSAARWNEKDTAKKHRNWKASDKERERGGE